LDWIAFLRGPGFHVDWGGEGKTHPTASAWAPKDRSCFLESALGAGGIRSLLLSALEGVKSFLVLRSDSTRSSIATCLPRILHRRELLWSDTHQGKNCRSDDIFSFEPDGRALGIVCG
jgi:hypothetical protein